MGDARSVKFVSVDQVSARTPPDTNKCTNTRPSWVYTHFGPKSSYLQRLFFHVRRCFSACRQLRKLEMGGVPDNYQCPWCRRINGGYSPDGVHYPICTQGPFSCLWHHWHDHNRERKTVVDLFDNGRALHYVFAKKFDVGWCTRVWQFCAGPQDPAPPSAESHMAHLISILQPMMESATVVVRPPPKKRRVTCRTIGRTGNSG